MEPSNNQFKQPEHNPEAQIISEKVFTIEEQALNNNTHNQVNESGPQVMPELRKGSKGEMVKKAQRILKTTSDYIGYVDGDFGWIMEAAVQSFQRRSKVAVTGIINNDTWNALSKIRN